jgi:hypothetical protein
MDFAEPPAPLDGCYPYLLAVRDLASGVQLLWLPVSDESAETALSALQGLFRQYLPPLVLKSDNGSAFIAGTMGAFLVQQRVWHLRSPRECPEYNGSCEAGIGSMKTRTHHQAACRQRPGEWSCEDAEAARLQANQTARPWGPCGPTPEAVWTQRQPIREEERTAFTATVGKQARAARRAQGHPAEGSLHREAQAEVDRAALVQALVEHGLLQFRGEYVNPTLPPRPRKKSTSAALVANPPLD